MAGVVKRARLDARINTLESRARLAGSRRSFTAPDEHDGHLQTRQRLVRVGRQIAGQNGCCREASVRLVSAAENVLDQFVGNQAGVVIALNIVVVLDGAARGQQVIDKLANDGRAQYYLQSRVERAWRGLL